MFQCPHCGAAVNERDRFCAACGSGLERDDVSSSAVDPLVGRTVGGAYVIQELIGVGGMGRVYRGVQTALGRTVAVKVIHPNLLGDEQTVARFYNEARAASRLNHPDSVGVIDFGRSDDGMLYLVMEFLSGKDLATVNADEGPLPFKRIVKILRSVASALGEAHALGVVHRDLKPENIIVQRSRRGEDLVKVVDFGLATITGPQKTSITTPGLVCGTPDYMSPEQGRGDTLDGRTDLYSMGVLLFELLTDRLPYIDDTPTKVVLRHIHDPVPDPRLIAPARGIPDVLAEIAIRALQKDAKDRPQTADELDEALRQAELSLENSTLETTRCGTCGATNPRTSRFCNACGGRLTGSAPAARFGGATAGQDRASAVPQTPRMSAPPAGRSSLIGREVEVERLLEARTASTARPVWVRLVGEQGVGKTRLLRELAARADAAADFVVSTGPHPSTAPVPYHAIRALVTSLLDAPLERLSELVQLGVIESPMARAGVAELLEPRGVPGLPGRSRAAAVGALLSVAVRVAAERSASGMIVLLVDDTHRCCALTELVLRELTSHVELTNVLLVTATVPGHKSVGAPTTMLLRGLSPAEASAMLTGAPAPPSAMVSREAATPAAMRLHLPLYIEQLTALGFTSLEEQAGMPERLADAVLARVSRLELRARRLLQTLTVLGEHAPREALRALLPDGDLGPLETLSRLGLVKTLEDDEIAVAHPFLREVVEASIPAEARKELHGRALASEAAAHAPLEVRAEHAYRAGEPMSAILILERMGDQALERGDPATATLAYRRGLEVARRESIHAGDTSLDPAVVTLSRKLGEALDRAGDHAGADGVLREAMELVGPSSRERGRMLLQLGRVAVHRDRAREAGRLFGQAIEILQRTKDTRYEAEAQLELGRLRHDSRELEAAVAPLERAIDLFERVESGADAELAQTALVAAESAVERGDLDAAAGHLLVALGRARSIGSGALLARVSIARARLLQVQSGNVAAADKLLGEARALAAEAGDADPLREATA